MKLKEYIDIRLKEINSEIDNIFEESNIELENQFLEMMKYPLDAGGKRIRPILTLLACEFFSEDYKKAIIPAISLELIHTYSLVHDDLPSMDNDDFRRGKHTTHIKYGEANAILVGDALLTTAFQILTKSSINNDSLRKVLYEISYATGYQGMVMGQMLDLYFENKQLDFEMLKNIHSKKTAAMIRAAIRVGALCSEQSSINIENITKYGEYIGLAFQIQDDILDVISDKDTLGKTAGKDQNVGKLTYVKQFGLEEAKNKANDAIEKAIKSLDNYQNSNAKSILIELAKYIVERQN